jgi:TetR/AcrR family transcriptional repressor of nem operon
MPYTVEHKARTRARIIESARVMFNRHGYERVSIDGIMREAGLTRGGFYNHFDSKEGLYAETVQSYASCNPFAVEGAKRAQAQAPRQAARRLVELYLSDAVLDDVDQHCPLYAVPSDVARAGRDPRRAYTQLARNMLAVFRGAFAASDPGGAAKAHVILGLCVGGMLIARTTDDTRLRRSMRAASLRHALALLEER